MLISICIPCYNSEKTISNVVESVIKELKKDPKYTFQFILVNDGSSDNTFGEIRKLCINNSNVKGVDLTRNFGQAQALYAAYNLIDGEIAVFMDDDGQHPADGVLKLVNKIEEGYDFALAKFEEKKQSTFKIFTSDMFRRVAEKCGTCPHGIYYSSFTAMSKVAIEAAKRYHGPFASIGAYLMNYTTKFVNVPMLQESRMSGKSGYNLRRLFGVAITSLTSFTIIPLRLANVMGAVISLASFIGIIAWVIYFVVFGHGFVYFLFLLLLLFSGINMLLIGLVGEYVGRTYMISSEKPQYMIRTLINGDDSIPKHLSS